MSLDSLAMGCWEEKEWGKRRREDRRGRQREGKTGRKMEGVETKGKTGGKTEMEGKTEREEVEGKEEKATTAYLYPQFSISSGKIWLCSLQAWVG